MPEPGGHPVDNADADEPSGATVDDVVRDVADWRRAAHALATAPVEKRNDVYQCGDWLATTHEDRILGVHASGVLASASPGAAAEYAVAIPSLGRKPVRGSDIDVRAWTVPSADTAAAGGD
jgi:hypothetical protein